MTTSEAFGIVLKELREERNLSQSKLAEESKLSRSYIVRLEKGERNPTIETLFRISKTLNIHSTVFIDRIEKKYRD